MSQSEGESVLKPLTFKVPAYMYKRIEELLEEDLYDNRADLIREAIEKLIYWELQIDSVRE